MTVPLCCACPRTQAGGSTAATATQHGNVSMHNSSSSLTILQLHYGPVLMTNTTLSCSAAAAATAPAITLVAETAVQLLAGIRLLGQLQPFTIVLARDMHVPASTWPAGLLVNHSMVRGGPRAGRGGGGDVAGPPHARHWHRPFGPATLHPEAFSVHHTKSLKPQNPKPCLAGVLIRRQLHPVYHTVATSSQRVTLTH